MSNFSESGNVKLNGKNVLIQKSSKISGSSNVEIHATENVEVSDNSHIEIGWKDAPNIENSLGTIEILWDSQTGQVVDHNNHSPHSLKTKGAVLNYAQQNMEIGFNRYY